MRIIRDAYAYDKLIAIINYKTCRHHSDIEQDNTIFYVIYGFNRVTTDSIICFLIKCLHLTSIYFSNDAAFVLLITMRQLSN